MSSQTHQIDLITSTDGADADTPSKLARIHLRLWLLTMPLTIDQQVSDEMVPATQEDKDYFDEIIRPSYFARDFLDVLKPYAYDVQPAINGRGMRRLEGWKAVYEVTVTQGM